MKQAYARRLYDAVMKNFLVSESTMAFLEFFPRRPEDRDTCYLFSYFGVGRHDVPCNQSGSRGCA